MEEQPHKCYILFQFLLKSLNIEYFQIKYATVGERLFNQPLQYNFNLIKPEPMDNMLPYGGGITGGTSPLYPATSTPPLPPMSAQGLRPRLSPRRTPSPMDGMQYNIPSVQNTQQNLEFPYMGGSPNPQLLLQPLASPEYQMPYGQQQPENPVVLNRVTPDPTGLGLQSLINTDGGVSNVLDLDSQQYSFDMSLNHLDSAELAIFGTPLSDNLSSGLSISDPVKPDAPKSSGANAANIGEGMNMTDSFTRMTNNTIQEICTLNSMYKPMSDNDNERS